MNELLHHSICGSKSVSQFLRQKMAHRTKRLARYWVVLTAVVVAAGLALQGCGVDRSDEPQMPAGQAKKLTSKAGEGSAAHSDGIGMPPAERTGDRMTQVFVLQEQLDRDVDGFVQTLAQTLRPDDAAKLLMLHRVYTTGQFLDELGRWLDRPECRSLVEASHRRQLHEFEQRWQQLETRVAGLAGDFP